MTEGRIPISVFSFIGNDFLGDLQAEMIGCPMFWWISFMRIDCMGL